MVSDLTNFTPDYFTHVSILISNIEYSILYRIIKLIIKTYSRDRSIFVIGNGGSAATASHFAADLAKNVMGKKIKSVCLTDSIPWLTAVANDLSYDQVFSEQLKTYARTGDLLVIFSASGNSPNLVRATKWARQNKLKTVAFLGFNGGKLQSMVDISLVVKSSDYGHVESIHSLLTHYLISVLNH